MQGGPGVSTGFHEANCFASCRANRRPSAVSVDAERDRVLFWGETGVLSSQLLGSTPAEPARLCRAVGQIKVIASWPFLFGKSMRTARECAKLVRLIGRTKCDPMNRAQPGLRALGASPAGGRSARMMGLAALLCVALGLRLCVNLSWPLWGLRKMRNSRIQASPLRRAVCPNIQHWPKFRRIIK